MLIFDANVSLSSFLKCLVTLDAILINSGSCSLVSVLCIGHSDSGNSKEAGSILPDAVQIYFVRFLTTS